MKIFMPLVFCLYAFAALLTFGYSYNKDYQEVGVGAIVTNGELNGSRALLCAMLWPAYWMVTAFDDVRPNGSKGGMSE